MDMGAWLFVEGTEKWRDIQVDIGDTATKQNIKNRTNATRYERHVIIENIERTMELITAIFGLRKTTSHHKFEWR